MSAPKYVIAHKYLPVRANWLHSILIYGLYSHVYALPDWVDGGVYTLLALVFIGMVRDLLREKQVHPKDLPTRD